jgi:hypothetical protein
MKLKISDKVRRDAADMRVVFLSGAISSDNGYQDKFTYASITLQRMGYVVLNPALLPDGLQHDQYLRITLAMLHEADGVCAFNDWAESDGARVEIEEALHIGKPIIRWADFQKLFIEEKAEFDAIDALNITTCPTCGKLISRIREHKCGKE